jgi:hypothetical protein
MGQNWNRESVLAVFPILATKFKPFLKTLLFLELLPGEKEQEIQN